MFYEGRKTFCSGHVLSTPVLESVRRKKKSNRIAQQRQNSSLKEEKKGTWTLANVFKTSKKFAEWHRHQLKI